MIESGANKYIESSNIRVFPCAYRGYYEANGESKVFDPEARATTEANFANTFHKLSSKKESYIISWDEGNGTNTVLKCVIGGYYFEIYNQAKTDFFYLRQSDRTSQPYALCIKTVSEELSNSTQDSVRKSSILASFERTDGTNNDRYLDVKKGSDYAFTGLTLLAEPSAEVSAHLVPFIASGDLNPAKFPITAILDTGTGIDSIRLLDEKAGDTTASGDYSVSLGYRTDAQARASIALCENTVAGGEGAVALGKNTKALGDYALSAGKDSEASSESSVALGTGTKTSNKNQVVLGQYNHEDSSQLLILANGTESRPSSANKFTVSYNGDVKALGTLETKGNITAAGAGKINSLTLGSSATSSSGAINVYGDGTNKVFSVTKTGDTNISGILDITNETQSTAVADGALIVRGGVGIKKNVNIGQSLDVAGNTNLKGTLTVASRDTSLGGKLLVKGVTTLNDNLTVNGKTTLKGDLEVAANKSIEFGSIVTILNDQEADATTAALTVVGGAKIGKNLIIESTTNSTSKDSGALVVKGGAGIDGDMYVNGAIYSPKGVVVTSGGATITGTATFEDTHISGDTAISGSTSIGGDTAISGSTSIEGDTVIKKTSTSTSKDTGALVVTGGVGIGENLNVGGALNIAEAFTAEKDVVIKGDTAIHKTLAVTKGITAGDNIFGAKNLTLSGNNTNPNTLTLGNSSAGNKGGQLVIYGTGTETVTEIDNTGTAWFAGNVGLEKGLTTGAASVIGGKLTIDSKVEISQNGITGLTKLKVNGPIEGTYFNATSYNTTSDARKKCNIIPYRFTNSILNLPINQFEYIDDVTHTKHIGCLAQDLQEICPELVTEDANGVLSIKESKLIYMLIQEVKELKEKIEMFERR